MEKLVKKLKNGEKVIFDEGRFDEWAVYVVDKNGNRQAPRDETYFSEFYEISKQYPKNKVYDDFVKIYELTDDTINPNTLKHIDKIVKKYKREHQEIVEKWFTVIYATMIAEENKKNAILKKRIKRLGMHQVLMLNMPAKKAAEYSKGRKSSELDKKMKEYGF